MTLRSPWARGAFFAVTLVAVAGALRVSIDASPLAVLRSNDPSFAVYRQNERWFSAETKQCLILLCGEELFSPEAVYAQRAIVRRVRGAPGVESVDSVLDLPAPKAADWLRRLVRAELAAAVPEQAGQWAVDHPVAAGHLISPDGGAALIIPRLDVSRVGGEAAGVVEDLRRIVQQETAGTALSGGVTGQPVFELCLLRRWRRLPFELVAVSLIGAIVAWPLLRSLRLSLIAVVAALFSMVWIFGMAGFAQGEWRELDLALPVFAGAFALLPAVFFVLATGNAERFAAGRSAIAAEDAAGLRRTLAAAVVTGVGYAGFLLAAVSGRTCPPPIVATATRVVAAIPVAMIVFVWFAAPSMIARPPWRQKARGEAVSGKDEPGGADQGRPGSQPHRPAKRISALGRPAFRYGLTAALVLLVVAGYIGARSIPFDLHISKSLPRTSEAARTTRDLERHFDGISYVYVHVSWPENLTAYSPRVMQVMEAVDEALTANPTTHHPLSIRNVFDSLPPPFDGDSPAARAAAWAILPQHVVQRFVHPEIRRAVVMARESEGPGRRSTVDWEPLRSRLNRVQRDHPGFELTLTGTPLLTERFVRQLEAVLGRGIPAALAALFVAQLVSFRSVGWAIAGLLLSSFPLAALALVAAVCKLPVSLASLLAGALVWGVVVQQTTYWLLTLRENLRRNPASARRRTDRTAGRACVVSGMVLLMEASCALLSDVPATREFAVVSCVGLILALLSVKLLSRLHADCGEDDATVAVAG